MTVQFQHLSSTQVVKWTSKTIKLETSPFLLVQVCFQLDRLTVSSGTGSGSVKIRGGRGTGHLPSGAAHTWVGFTQLSSPNPDPCEAEEEHGVPPLHVNLTHVTHPRGKGTQLLFLEPQTACKQLKGGCCGKLRRGGSHLRSLPPVNHSHSSCPPWLLKYVT